MITQPCILTQYSQQHSVINNKNPSIISTIDLWKTKVDAAHNYWNYNETLAVGGRIRDRFGRHLLHFSKLDYFYLLS